MNAEPAIAAEAKRSANSLFGIKIFLLPKIISLTIFSGKLHRNGCGTGAFCTVFASKTPEIAKFPVNFPVTREIRMETGSHQTAHTALLILSASVNVVASIFFISILGLTGAAIATTIALIVWNVAMAFFISRHLRLLPGILGMLGSKLRRSLGPRR